MTLEHESAMRLIEELIQMTESSMLSNEISTMREKLYELKGVLSVTLKPVQTKSVEIVSMTRDHTEKSRSPFWRCFTSEGISVNVFKHDDELKDNFHLFVDAGYGLIMMAMEYGETLNWTQDPVLCDVVAQGRYWNVVVVTACADTPKPDTPESDENEDTGADS